MVSPRYARAALKIYSELDPKKYYSVAVLDTEKAASSQAAVFKNSLAEEIGVKEAFLAPYMELLLGKVIKCRSIEELSDCKIGITPECLLYHNLRLQHINPEHYTVWRTLERTACERGSGWFRKNWRKTKKAGLPLEAVLADCRRISGLSVKRAGRGIYAVAGGN